MKGLIIKDLLFLKSTWKNMFILFVGSLLISIALGNYLLSLCSLPVMLLSSCINTFQTDEFYNTESYTLSFPLSRKQIILAKFIFTFIMLLISTLIGCLIYLGIRYTINPGHDGLNMEMFKMFFMMEMASLIVDSIFYPVIYKYGCEKSRLVLMSIVMLLLGLAAILSVSVNVYDANIDFQGMLSFVQNYGIYIVSAIVFVFLILSYILSYRFYRHKDY